MANEEEKSDQIQIADNILKIIAGIAVSKVEGVVEMSGTSVVGNLASRVGKKDLTKGVTVERSEEGEVESMSVSITVSYGVKIHEVSKNVQKDVREAIKNMADLDVKSVKVNVEGVKVTEEEGE